MAKINNLNNALSTDGKECSHYLMQDPHIIECNIHKCLLQVIRQKCKNLDCKEGFICKHFCENVFLLSELGTKTPLSFENDFVCSSSKIGNKSSQQNLNCEINNTHIYKLWNKIHQTNKQNHKHTHYYYSNA